MASPRRTVRAIRRRLGRLVRLADPLGAHRAQLPTDRNRTVVVLTGGRSARRWLWPLRRDSVHVLTDSVNAGQLVSDVGPADVIIDLEPRPAADVERMWEQLFLHLRSGGTYVVGRTGSRSEFDGHVSALATRLRAPRPQAPEPHIFPSTDYQLASELASARGRVTSGANAILVRKKNHHMLKLREDALPRVLPRREPQIRFRDLETLPAGSFGPTAAVHHYGPASPEAWGNEAIHYPAMRLRHYEGRIGFAGRSLVHGQATILPDSYHWWLADDPRNPFTENAGADFARIPSKHAPKRDLVGNYYLLDPNYGAYGHLLTEVVPRLWGWDRAKSEIADLKALFWVRRESAVTGDELVFRLARAYGIPAEDIVWTSRPAWVSSLVAPTLMWHNRTPFYVHPDLPDVWRRLGHSLIDSSAPTPERIFVARTDKYGRRICRNDAAVQQFFADRGFTVIYPETLGLAAQAALFAGAKVLAGYGGSGLFNVMFSQKLEALIVLNQDSYPHRNEWLYAAALGVPVHFVWSRADIAHPPGQRSFAATESAWEFDFEDNGPALDRLLAAL